MRIIILTQNDSLFLPASCACVCQDEIGEARKHATTASEIDAEIGAFTAAERAEISDIPKMESVANQPGPLSGGEQ